MKVIVIYYSKGGTTRKMAEIIAEEIKNKNVEAHLFPVEKVKPEDLLMYDGIIVGSPTYYGTMAYQIKKLLDESVVIHGKLEGKVGGVFSSSANVGGGNESTLLSILEAMLIHGMIIQGDYKGDHYGPVVVGKVDERGKNSCRRFATRFVELLRKVQEK